MFICVECGKKSTAIFSNTKKILSYKNCYKKMDRYFEVNNTLLIIDILLLRVEVFRHIIYNRTFCNQFIFYIFYFISRFVFISRYFNLSVDNLSDLYLLIGFKIVICLFLEIISGVLIISTWRQTGVKITLYSLLLTSFYYLFVYVMILWDYKEIEYYIMVEFLVLLANSIGLSCVVDGCVEGIFVILLFSKLLFYLSCGYLI